MQSSKYCALEDFTTTNTAVIFCAFSVAGVPPFDVKRDVDGCRPAKYKTADFTGKVWDKVSQDGKSNPPNVFNEPTLF